MPTIDILFTSNHNIHKSSCGICFWASDPLIDRFYKNLSIKGSIVGMSNIKILQNETVSTLNALTIYIISCMLFIATAMIQYGILLYLSRLHMKSKVNTEKSEMDEKWDRRMLIMYVIIFTLFNLIYFMTYLC